MYHIHFQFLPSLDTFNATSYNKAGKICDEASPYFLPLCNEKVSDKCLHIQMLLWVTFKHPFTDCYNVRGEYSDNLVFTSLTQFIPLCRDILVAINVLPLNITFTYC